MAKIENLSQEISPKLSNLGIEFTSSHPTYPLHQTRGSQTRNDC